MNRAYEEAVLQHYREQAASQGLKPTSTMSDQIVREREMDGILRWTAALTRGASQPTILDVGCGNGLTLAELRRRHHSARLVGRDYSQEMTDLARSRAIPACDIQRGDVRMIDLAEESIDVIVSQRCVINLLDRDDQKEAFRSLHRTLRPGGHLVAIEAFADAQENLNRARVELGLTPIAQPVHNLWFDSEFFAEAIRGLFVPISPEGAGDATLPAPNFLSSHYFMSRVVHACVTRGEQKSNTEFVKFFSVLPPIGNYSPVQIHVLRKEGR